MYVYFRLFIYIYVIHAGKNKTNLNQYWPPFITHLPNGIALYQVDQIIWVWFCWPKHDMWHVQWWLLWEDHSTDIFVYSFVVT